jgi:cell fate (sporulation/competence/biofilm development) regulator YlbF (YheA/YmcA/DUF963 family)
VNDIIDMAARLGKAIARSPQAETLRKARAAMNAQNDVMQLLRDFQKQSERIAELQENDKPIEVEEKHKLDELHEQLLAKDVFKSFTAAQVEYVDLMRKVNEAISMELGAKDE